MTCLPFVCQEELSEGRELEDSGQWPVVSGQLTDGGSALRENSVVLEGHESGHDLGRADQLCLFISGAGFSRRY